MHHVASGTTERGSRTAIESKGQDLLRVGGVIRAPQPKRSFGVVDGEDGCADVHIAIQRVADPAVSIRLPFRIRDPSFDLHEMLTTFDLYEISTRTGA